jgi:hypothetical protein
VDIETPASAPEAPQPRPFTVLHKPLSQYQTVVGIGAGLVTILGTLGSMIGFSSPVVQAELMTTVHNARSRVPVSGATIEIRTATDAVVTTLSADGDGRARYKVREGEYRLRVTHPQYLPDVKSIQVQGGQIADIRVALVMPIRVAPKPPPPPLPEPPPKAPNFFQRLFQPRAD